MNVLFAFLYRFNVWCTKPCQPLEIPDTLFLAHTLLLFKAAPCLFLHVICLLGNGRLYQHTAFPCIKSFACRFAQTAWQVPYLNAKWWILILLFFVVLMYETTLSGLATLAAPTTCNTGYTSASDKNGSACKYTVVGFFLLLRHFNPTCNLLWFRPCYVPSILMLFLVETMIPHVPCLATWANYVKLECICVHFGGRFEVTLLMVTPFLNGHL